MDRQHALKRLQAWAAGTVLLAKSAGTRYSTWDVGHSRNEDMFEGRHGDPDLFT